MDWPGALDPAHRLVPQNWVPSLPFKIVAEMVFYGNSRVM